MQLSSINIKGIKGQNRISDRFLINPIIQLTKSILEYNKKDMLMGKLYKQIYNEKREEIVNILNSLTEEELFSLLGECDLDKNSILYDECVEILKNRIANVSLIGLLNCVFEKKISLELYTEGYYFLENSIIGKIKQLSEQELDELNEYLKDKKIKLSNELGECKNYRLNPKELVTIENESIEEKIKLIEKAEKLEYLLSLRIFRSGLCQRIYSFTMDLKEEKREIRLTGLSTKSSI